MFCVSLVVMFTQFKAYTKNHIQVHYAEIEHGECILFDTNCLFNFKESAIVKLLILMLARSLEANVEKSYIYVSGLFYQQILILLYLEIPLSSQKLFYHECKPLVEKIVRRTKSWAAKLVTDAQR